MCFFGGRMTCHFFVILENGEGACLLGNYDADETIFDDNRTDLRVKFREGNHEISSNYAKDTPVT